MDDKHFNYHYSVDLNTLSGDKSTEFIDSLFTDKFYVDLLNTGNIYDKMSDLSKLKFNNDIVLFGEFAQILADTNISEFNSFIKYVYTDDNKSVDNIISKWQNRVNIDYFDKLFISFISSLDSLSIFSNKLLSLTSENYSIWGGSIFNIFQLNKIARTNNKEIISKFSYSIFKRILILKNI